MHINLGAILAFSRAVGFSPAPDLTPRQQEDRKRQAEERQARKAAKRAGLATKPSKEMLPANPHVVALEAMVVDDEKAGLMRTISRNFDRQLRREAEKALG